MTFRGFMLWSHRWLGLGGALVIALAGFTGAVVLLPLPEHTLEWWMVFHMNLAAGPVGRWIVVAATLASVLLQIGGVYLWWPSKSLRLRTDRGWWRTAYDLHNLTGVVGLLIMGLLAATALGRVFFSYVEVPAALDLVPRATARLHTASGFPWPLKVVYALGSLAFVLQAITGALVWWRPSAALPPRAGRGHAPGVG